MCCVLFLPREKRAVAANQPLRRNRRAAPPYLSEAGVCSGRGQEDLRTIEALGETLSLLS